MAPHIEYPEADCPHYGCDQPMKAIDFRLEAEGHAVHDRLDRDWWEDKGFVGRCPHCKGWIHFTAESKRAVTTDEAAGYPQLPDDWYTNATIL